MVAVCEQFEGVLGASPIQRSLPLATILFFQFEIVSPEVTRLGDDLEYDENVFHLCQ